MEIIYWIIIKLYGLSIHIAAPFNTKARGWVRGRKYFFKTLRENLVDNEQRIWFHCSSLGEFEQGKPVLERLKDEYPNHKIVLTFFSPSGYDVKKNDPVADYVFYLPLDGPVNSKWFIEYVNPAMAIFVKYDFWHFYIKYLAKKRIPSFVISANFRPNQIYFKPYGLFFHKILRRITHIFVQTQSSLELLYKNSITRVTVSGDTRFDRVYVNSHENPQLQKIEFFTNDKKVLIAGSTWHADEDLIVKLINTWESDWKYIIAPHEISKSSVKHLQQQISVSSALYSELSTVNLTTNDYRVLIIDNIGMLSKLYAYADAAYIGGGFGAGVHNILEAAVFGLPVFFGPHYHKSHEAIDLLKQDTAFDVNTFQVFYHALTAIANDESKLDDISRKNVQYVESRLGATDVIINYLKMNHA